MSTTERPMPDFADALERHLRAAAQATVVRPTAPAAVHGRRRAHDGRPRVLAGRRGLRRPFAAAGSLALVALVLVLVLALGGSGPGTSRAFGAPLVLRTPLVPLPEGSRPGISAEIFIGPDSGRITKGHRISTAAGPAFLYGDERGRCLTAPVPGVPRPEVNRGVTCVRGASFRRSGIAGWIGDEDRATYIAAVPQGVRNPTVSYSGGPPRELVPSDIGVIVVRTTEPAVVTRYDVDGRATRDALAQSGTGPDEAARPTRRGTPVRPGAGTPPTPAAPAPVVP
ncbi:unannotated protein [freshwater metagenome]|uniref:Unannotated protein n=1 Tax=freshwater metagenome TaxID=449393 RepID=A0A6J7GCM0_9ZZZZ|nr:hypothetical protein [Actinomycetota bacterium]